MDHPDDPDDQGEDHPPDQGAGHLDSEANGASAAGGEAASLKSTPVAVFGRHAMPR